MSPARRERAEPVHEVLKALAEPRRVAILRLVHARELPAGEIAKRFSSTRQAVSQHLRLLTEAGLLQERREGTRRLYRLRPEAFEQLREFLGTFWDERLASLKRAVERDGRTRRGRR
ncbi:MAG TPA: metalloregulator ArsR/SmtB family transcription factor [Myxococcota bacterium]|nr:metalloregulator ArsR/SmtB family transcription factor [Myxococcota bacterium]